MFRRPNLLEKKPSGIHTASTKERTQSTLMYGNQAIPWGRIPVTASIEQGLRDSVAHQPPTLLNKLTNQQVIMLFKVKNKKAKI